MQLFVMNDRSWHDILINVCLPGFWWWEPLWNFGSWLEIGRTQTRSLLPLLLGGGMPIGTVTLVTVR